MRDHKGKRKFLEISEKIHKGDIIKWFGTCTDIDDQKRAEFERQQVSLIIFLNSHFFLKIF